MSEGTCNKCGEQKELVLAGCVCGGCADCLDRQWAHSRAIDWVLIYWSAEFGPCYTFYRNTTYARVKSLWATWSEQSRPGNNWDLGHYTWSPVPPYSADVAEEINSHSVAWSKRPDTPFVRPAIPEEIEQRNEIIGRIQIPKVSAEAYAKWGLDSGGAPLDSRWDWERTLQAYRGAYPEIRDRLEQLGLFNGSVFDDEEMRETLFGRSMCDTKELTAIPSNETIQATPPPLPGRGLSQVAGMSDLKEQLMHEVIGPFKDPDLYRRYRVSLPNGILFYGPPGCGKTYIARSLAEELGWSFQYCRPSDVASPYIHDTVSRIRAVFAAATEKAPSIVFIDEFEAFVPARSELGGHQQYKAEEVNEFLANLEGCAERRVLVIAATNEPEKIDPAVRRSGRFDKLIFIAPPDTEARRAMLDFHLRERPVDGSLDTAGIATVLDGYSASDIKLLVDEASRMALKRTETISTSTLLTALERVPASISAIEVQRYAAFRARG